MHLEKERQARPNKEEKKKIQASDMHLHPITNEHIQSERSRFDLFLTHLRNKTTLTTTKWILIQCIHKHPVSGTPSWTTIDLTSLFIKSLSKLPKYCNAAKHSSNYQKLAMGFSIWPILIFKISHVCKLKWQHSPSSVTISISLNASEISPKIPCSLANHAASTHWSKILSEVSLPGRWGRRQRQRFSFHYIIV